IVAKMKIVSSNHRNKLYLFNMFDWKHEYTQPVLNFYEVSVSFPDILTVYADGIKQTGTPGENGMIDYYVSSTSPIKLAVEDVYGNKLDIDVGTKVETQSFLFNIPSNFTLKVAGEVVSSEGLEVTPNPDYQYVSEVYPDMPGFVTYEIVCLDTETSRGRFEILDNLNNPVDFEWDMTTVTLTEQSALDTVPESVLAEVDVMKFAEDFRYYMSADLGDSSKKYGFDKIKEWFIKDSFFYKVVENWFKNIDITFISGHTNLNPVFTDKVMDHYISFGDDCFLVHLSLVQNMKLRDGQYYSDPFDEYCYFVKYDDTDDGKDNPRWVVVDMFSPPVIEEEPEE
ncbi:MAG: hypothetical protein J5850_01575, partial [Clostridia bacterium]|nr:hypothetical protein [Clostridia bacterium]